MNRRRTLEDAKSWHHKCPECGTTMTGTGSVIWDFDVDHWYVEFWCPEDEETLTIYTPELHDRIATQLG